jgi:hypothetical protein
MKDQILKIAKVKSEKEFYKKYPSEEAFMKAHGKAFKKAAMGKSMVNDQLHQLTDFGNPPIAQTGINYNKYFQGTTQFGLNPDGTLKQVGDAFNNASMAQYSGQQAATQASAQYATPSSDQLLGKNAINSGEEAGGIDGAGVAAAAIGALPGIIAGVEAIGAQKKAKKKAEQATQLSGLALQAQQTTQKAKRKYVRPEDALLQPGQLGNPYGTGTNYLAKNGTMIGGNPTEIQNMYNPGDMYTDLGFEPLGETLKQYKHGGEMPKAEFGEYFQSSGQAQIGSAAGTAIGSLVGGPLGGAIGGLIGTVGGNLLGGAKQARELQKEKDKAEMNTQQAAFAQAQQNQFGAYMEQGGKVDVGDEYKWVSHTWQPQTFTKFGEYSAKDLLKPPHDADMLRSGGHLAQVGYTAPSEEALYTGRPNMPNAQNGVQMAMGGDLEVGDGGRLETLSYNPNLPGGEIGMFRGASHDNGGIKTKYGENEVEVEGNEPVVKLKDDGSSENLVVFGNIKINKEIADLMGDPKAKGKKFKTYIADVAKNDAKQLKRIDKGLELIENANENSAFDHLTLNTGKAIMQGAKAWQKINADKIKEAGIVQDSIHKTANELGVKSDKLAEGKLEKETDPSMMGKNGKKIKKAQGGIAMSTLKGLDDEALLDPDYPERMELLKAYYSANDIDRKMMREGKVQPGMMGIGTNILPSVEVTGNRHTSKGKQEEYIPMERKPLYDPSTLKTFNAEMPDIKMASQQAQAVGEGIGEAVGEGGGGKFGDILKKYGPTLLSTIAPFLRPSNANEDLPPDQLYPEYFALATNQLEPVQAQTYQPMLDTPYDISLNDQLNAIDSQSRAAIRAAGQNPAAQAMIMSQSLEAKNKVLGEQTRINQANKMQVYDKNRALLNDAQLKNLAILDQQYVRQSQARSNTKAQTQAALSSIAAKTAKQRASNRKLAIMENMYGFRFSPSGRAINMNAPAQFDLSGSGSGSGYSNSMLPANKRFTIDPVTKKIAGIMTLTKEEMAGNTPSLSEINSYLDDQKNGGKTSKTKARNSSIVKALKNL